jgi:hypothetical protein
MLFSFVLGVLVLGAGRQPQVAAAGSRVAVVAGEPARILTHVSSDGGRTFAPAAPIPLNGKMPLGMRRGPRVAVTRDAIVVTAVTGPLGGGKDGDIYAWRSVDGGKSWSGPVRLNAVVGSGREGLHGMASNARGEILVSWLDLRGEGTRVFGARSSDSGRTWRNDELIYAPPGGGVCECCSITPAVGGDGSVAVLFRNHLDGARDMYLASGPQWNARKLGEGTWPLEACPMDGGDLKLDSRGRAAVVWRREKQVYATVPGESREILLGDGKDGAVAWLGEMPLFAWTDAGRLRLSRGARADAQVLDAKGAYASAASVPGAAVVVWESSEGVKAARLTAVE